MPYLCTWILPVLTGLSFALAEENPLWTWLPTIAIFLVHPLLDQWLARYLRVGHAAASQTESHKYNLILWGYVGIQSGLWIWVLSTYSVWQFNQPLHSQIAMMIGLGLSSGGIGITAAHELVHRNQKWERALGTLLLLQVNYPQFRYEHVYGHHKWVGTPQDPASAVGTPWFWRFALRSIGFSFAHTLLRDFRRPWIHRLFVRDLLFLVIIHTVIWKALGAQAWIIFVAQSLVAIFLLEGVNYLQHVTLERKRQTQGWEMLGPQHSWDCDFPLTNWFLFNLGLHSSHHQKASLPYWELTAQPQSRRHRFGYVVTLLTVLITGRWRLFLGRQQ